MLLLLSEHSTLNLEDGVLNHSSRLGQKGCQIAAAATQPRVKVRQSRTKELLEGLPIQNRKPLLARPVSQTGSFQSEAVVHCNAWNGPAVNAAAG